MIDAAKAERNRRWRAENSEAITAYEEEIAQDGLALSQLRSF
ncbi:type II toxin-antitoxin system CcdA family antitoxin [Yoonia sp.]